MKDGEEVNQITLQLMYDQIKGLAKEVQDHVEDCMTLREKNTKAMTDFSNSLTTLANTFTGYENALKGIGRTLWKIAGTVGAIVLTALVTVGVENWAGHKQTQDALAQQEQKLNVIDAKADKAAQAANALVAPPSP